MWCVANQTLQTTRWLREKKRLPRVERSQPWLAAEGRRWWTCGHCCYAFWCLPCAVALALEDGVGMPCWMGFWCTTPCGGRNIVKSHYRIGVSTYNECFEDCCLPSTACALTHTLPPISWLLLSLYFARFVNSLRWEVDARTPPAVARKRARSAPKAERRYLAGYDTSRTAAMAAERAFFNVHLQQGLPAVGTGNDLDVTMQQPI